MNSTRGRVLAFWILLVCLTGTFFFWQYVRHTTEKEVLRKFEAATEEAHQLIQDRLNLCLNGLYGFQGLFAASHSIGREEFAAYAQGIRLWESYPGLSSVSFVERVGVGEKEAFLQKVRSDTSMAPQGYPDFTIYPVGERAEYWVVDYTEPFAGNEELHGFDLSTEPVRREAMEKTRDTGGVSATGRLTLLSGVGDRSGFLVFLPVFRKDAPHATIEERRAAVQGFILGRFETAELFNGLFLHRRIPSGIDFEVFDGEELSDEHLLYDYNPGERSWKSRDRKRLMAVRTMPLTDQTWRLYSSAPPGFGLNLAEQRLPTFVLSVGLIFSFLLFGILYSLATSHARSLTLAEKMMRDRHESEERYRLMAENSTDLISRHSPEGICLYASPVCRTLLGFEPEELVGRPAQEFFHPQDLMEVETARRAASPEPPDVETIRYRVRRKDGRYIWFETTSRKIRQPETGAVLEIVSVSRDITERQRAEKELVRLAAFPEENPNPVIEIDRTGAISYLNLETKVRFPELTSSGLRHPLLEGVTLVASELKKGGKATTGREVRIGDSVFEEMISVAPGGLVRIYVNDITQRKRLEKQRQEQAEALERSNQEMVTQQKIMQSILKDLRTSKEQLEEQSTQLQATNKRLEELVALKDEFVAKVSHELRTPLTAIKEGVSLILDGALGGISKEQRDFLKTVDENIGRLTELINNLLDFSKIQAGRLHLQRQRVSIQDLIETTLKSYRLIAGERTITVDCSSVPDVFADPNRILQVLGNLFANAIKFTSNKGTILFAVKERGENVAVSVRDNGVGMSAEDLPKLFQKFSQVGDGTSKRRGTGLGLALSKELVEMHEGTIQAESEEEKGSVFTFTLPVYASRLALEKSFEELVEYATRSDQERVGLVAVHLEPFLPVLLRAIGQNRRVCLERVAEIVRQNVKKGDLVVDVEPSWVTVLSVADAPGLGAIVQRLQTVLTKWLADMAGVQRPEAVQIGTAVYPLDGTNVHALFLKANQLPHQGLTTG